MKARSTHTLVGGGGFLVGLGLAGTAYVYVFLVGLGIGAVIAALAFYGVRLGRRLVGRVDRALPDSGRLGWDDKPLTGDPDYLAGVERGIRNARRSAGIEDGRMIEGDRVVGRDFP